MDKKALRLEYMKLYAKKNKSQAELERFEQVRILLG